MANREVVVLSAVRTAVGEFGGALKDQEPGELGALVVRESIKRAGVDPDQVSFVAVGSVIPTDHRSPYVGRVASVKGGLDPAKHVTVTVNRLCGSSQQAIVSTAQAIITGDADFGLGVGTEVMSRGGYLMPAARFGARMGDTKMVDLMVSVITDPFEGYHMGITAENVAAKWGISREDQDAFALESQRRALAAIAAGHFKSQIVPVELATRKGVTLFETDERPRTDVTQESLAKMKPAFKKDGTVTAGNASGINDGAGSILLAEAGAAARAGYKPLARLVAWGIAGVDNKLMGEGPIPSTQVALKRAGLTLDQIDVIESNEAFSAQSLAVLKGLGRDPKKTNPNGGAVALGHPVGATGAIIVTKLIHEMHRVQARYGLATMCIGGGQGITTIYERL